MRYLVMTDVNVMLVGVAMFMAMLVLMRVILVMRIVALVLNRAATGFTTQKFA